MSKNKTLLEHSYVHLFMWVGFLADLGLQQKWAVAKKDKKACEAENIYYLVPYRKGLPSPV